ncbi:zinc-binding dehydrogenase [Pseudomonas sp. CVAP|uniref:zinc-binding dehydrogenase n=1 Tax=Pseudomonas sp. CVAP\|nr:zinc-binding dehydrogenase [Pseudomonas sp. CVAP\
MNACGAAVQIARHAGATVIATASIGNHGYLKTIGANQLIDYRSQAFEEVVKDVDIVLDLMGGETQRRSWKVLKQGGVLVSPVSTPDAELAKAHGVSAKNFATRADGRQLTTIAEMIDCIVCAFEDHATRTNFNL